MLSLKLPFLAQISPGMKIFLSLMTILVASSWALLHPGLFFVHDTLHIARAAEMWRALSSGHFPVRWSQHFGFGYGIPLFEFYAPLPSYFASLLFGLAFPQEIIFKALILIPNIATVVGSYKLGKKLSNDWGGVLTAALITLAPYRAVNLFVRGAFSEAWAMMFFPLIILSLVMLVERKKWAWLCLVLSLSGLFLSHNITTLLFTPFSLVFGLGYWLLMTKKRDLGFLCKLASSYFLAGALAAYYLVPAFLEKNLVKIEAVTDAYYNLNNHFIYIRQFLQPFWGYGGSQPALNDGLSFFLGWGFWVGLVLSIGTVVAWLYQNRKVAPKSQTLWLWFLASSLMVFAYWLTIGRSAWLWNSMSALSFVQFPWRVLGTAAFWTGLSFVIAWSMITSQRLKLIVWGLLSLSYLLGNLAYFRPDFWLENPNEEYFSDVIRMNQELGPTLREYIPQAMLQNPEPATGEILRIKTIGPYSQRILEDRVQFKKVEIYSFQDAQATWQMAAYPGWQVSEDRQLLQTEVDASGLITHFLPKGTHTLELKWNNTLIRTVSDTISLLATITLAALILIQVSSKFKKLSL